MGDVKAANEMAFPKKSFRMTLQIRNESCLKCTVSQNEKKKTPVNFNTNYRGEIKLIPINMNYCLLQFDALKFF